ncbi:MAG: endonuclease/exonuclease/phosphatase family protein [Candidatus Hodarchaeota archaeon]
MLLLEFNAVLLFMATFLAYLFSVPFYRHYTRNDKRKWLSILGEMALIVLAGPWVSFLTAYFFTVLSIRVFGYLWFKDEHFKNRGAPDLKMGQRIRAGFFRFILSTLMISLVVSYVTAQAGRITGGDWVSIVSFAAGTALALVWSVKKHVPFYNRQSKILINSRESVAFLVIIAVMVPLTFAGQPNNLGWLAGGIEIRTMSFNIHYPEYDGDWLDWTVRGDNVSDYIESFDPDIFGLQESFLEQVESLNTTLSNRNYSWCGNGREPDGGGEIDSIFYDQDRFNLLENGTFWLSYTPEVSSTVFSEIYPRTVGWARLEDKSTGGQFYFYTTHYGFYMEFNIWASHLVNTDIASRTGDLPVIFMGDYNSMSLPIVPFYSFLEGYGSKPLYQAHRLLHGYADPLKIDYILVTPDIHVFSYTVHSEYNEAGQRLSDHGPIVMRCMLPLKS